MSLFKISFTMKLFVVLYLLTILCHAGLSKTILGNHYFYVNFFLHYVRFFKTYFFKNVLKKSKNKLHFKNNWRLKINLNNITLLHVLGFGISTNQQQQIVDLHNDFRLRIANGTVSGQPRGINLLRVVRIFSNFSLVFAVV